MVTPRALVPRLVTLADQVLSSVSNVLVFPLVAPRLSESDLGRFVLAFIFLGLTLTVSRTYFGTRVSLAPDHAAALRLTGNVLGALIVIAPLLVLALLGISTVATGGHSLELVLPIALVTPFVCMQDIIRFGAAAAGRPWTALVSDGVWVAIMVTPLILNMRLSASDGLMVWAGGALAALAVAWAGIRLRPSLRLGIAELRRRDRVAESMTVGYLGLGLASYVTLAFVGRAVGLAATASLGVASRAMGPINVLFGYIALAITPILVRRPRNHDLQFCVATAAIMGVCIVGWGLLLLAVPTAWGVAVLGESWHGVREVLPWTVLEYVFLAVSTASGLGLKVRGQAAALIRQRAAAAVVTVVAGCGVAIVVDKAWAVAAALAMAALASAVLGWLPLTARAAPTSSGSQLTQPRLSPLGEA